ncbi:MAG: hypothetical protein KW788_01875 [Candidatus Doudnabacteria bacterium]|nr:hypothetical protein [Candidatus Doudnabacteria bacterium]
MVSQQQAVEAVRISIGLLMLWFMWFVLFRKVFEDVLDHKICELDANLDTLFREAYEKGFKGFAGAPHFELRKRVWLLYGGQPSLGLYFLLLMFKSTRLAAQEDDFRKFASKIRDHAARQQYLEVYDQLLYAIGLRLVHVGFLARRLKHIDVLLSHYLRMSEWQLSEADS